MRASGGSNGSRHLVVPGYNTNIDHTVTGFELPADPVGGRLILSVHYDDPYLFALQATTNTWGSASANNVHQAQGSRSAGRAAARRERP